MSCWNIVLLVETRALEFGRSRRGLNRCSDALGDSQQSRSRSIRANQEQFIL